MEVTRPLLRTDFYRLHVKMLRHSPDRSLTAHNNKLTTIIGSMEECSGQEPDSHSHNDGVIVDQENEKKSCLKVACKGVYHFLFTSLMVGIWF